MIAPRLAPLVVALVLLPGCADQPLFTVNKQVEFTAPAELSTVTLPLRVTWRGENLPPDAQRYALFVDRRPIAPGESLSELTDDTCQQTPGCPDATYLENLGIFLTTDPEVELASLPVLGGLVARTRPVLHRVTVVLISAAGARVGEYAYDLQFRLSEPDLVP